MRYTTTVSTIPVHLSLSIVNIGIFDSPSPSCSALFACGIHSCLFPPEFLLVDSVTVIRGALFIFILVPRFSAFAPSFRHS